MIKAAKRWLAGWWRRRFPPHEHRWRIRWSGGVGDWFAECTGARCDRKRFPPMWACIFDEGREFNDAELDAHIAGGHRKGPV